jgi:hypothetical protein
MLFITDHYRMAKRRLGAAAMAVKDLKISSPVSRISRSALGGRN